MSQTPEEIAIERIQKAIESGANELDLSELNLQSLPLEIVQLQNLTALNLSSNQLISLSAEIGQFQNLTKLNLYTNKLASLPPEISQLTNLTQLNLSRNKLAGLLPEIGQLTNLTSLDLSSNQLASLPSELGQLQNLTQLVLSGNQLTSLPSAISELQNLTQLVLSGNKLTSLPPEIVQLQNLAQLVLSGNQLTSLPPEIVQLQNLTRLDLTRNQLANLPPEIVQLKNLTQLVFSGNQLTSLPSTIYELQNLTQLDLSDNQLSSLSTEIMHLQNLKRLDISSNKFADLPLEIAQLQKLEQLKLSNNQLTNLPSPISELQYLTLLELSSNQLASLPPEIGKLQNLTSLDLSGNGLTNLPPEITKLTNLRNLFLSNNQVTSIPSFITQLTKLETLFLFGNQINVIPPEIAELSNLVHLVFTKNRLTSLPTYICQLTNLQSLYLSGNQLTSLPVEISQLQKLNTISLKENPLEISIPENWLGDELFGSDDAQRIILYYKQMYEEGGCPLGEARVLVVGEANAGKTKLIRGLLFSEFGEKFKDSRTPTDGIEVTLSEDEGISLRFWDFGGQEMMHSTHTFFLSQRCVYVLLADSTENPDQIEEKIESWLERIQVYGKNSPVILVASKMEDMPFSINERRLKEKYTNLVLPEAIRTSTKTGRGINDLRYAIFEQAKKLPTLNVPLPRSFLAVKDALERMKSDEKVKTIEEKDYRRVCQENGVDEEERQNTLLQLLHDMGVVFHYEDPRLNHFAIFNPNWATGAVYKVITSLQVNDSHGRFSLEGLRTILKDEEMYPASMHPRIVDLMQFFELIYELHGKRDHYILPSSLSKDHPVLNEWDVPAMKFEYHYKPALLISVLHRFIVAQHDYVDEGFLWYSGVGLNYKENRVLIQADTRAKCITVKIIGEEKTRKELLYAIRMEFERIHGENMPEENIYPPEHPNLKLSFESMKILAKSEKEYKTVYQGKPVTINLNQLLEGFVTLEERRKDEEREKQKGKLGDTFITNNNITLGNMEGSNLLLGEGHNIQQTLNNSFNTFPPETQNALLELMKLTEALLSKAEESESKEELRDELARLKNEADAAKPKAKIVKPIVERLADAAKNLNDIGKPVLELATTIIKLINTLP